MDSRDEAEIDRKYAGGQTMSRRPTPRRHLVRLLPMLAYTIVYSGTCLIGAFLLLLDWRPFVAYFEYFSGTVRPSLSGRELASTLVLLIVAPIIMWIGFLAGTYIRLDSVDRVAARIAGVRLDAPAALPIATFAVSLSVALLSLTFAGAFSNIGSWLHYAAWITARQEVFAQLSFAAFVNLYMLLPLSAAWVAVGARLRGGGLALVVLTTTLAVGTQLLLFQRKAMIVALLIVLVALALQFTSPTPAAARRLRLAVGMSIMAVISLYLVLVVVPVYQQTRQTALTVVGPGGETVAPVPASSEELERRKKLAEKVGLANHTKALVIYSLLSPLTRTSAASLHYADVFPRRHGFYGFGIGDGHPTDDTRVVWDYMNPTLPGGTVAAPFQFGMFALWGLIGSLAACAAVGVGLSLLWRLVIEGGQTRDWQSLLGSLVVLLAIYLAIDSVQNSIIVSYGVLWGLLFIAAWICLGLAARRRH